jgi:ribosome-binding ATPase YchF (GTP1/OBG family)
MEIAQIADAVERKMFLDELGLRESGLDQVIRTGYRTLGLQTFYTVGPKEAHAWTITAGMTAPAAAGKIHTDFERGFIRAELISSDDYLALGSETAVKEAGKMRLVGRDYVMQPGDVCHFLFNN